jgi:chitodextrinase
VDTTPPSAPTNLTLNTATSSSLAVRWTASTDDVGVVIYQVLVNGNQVSVASSTSATITGLASGTVYGVSVRALDAAGNVSASSTSLYVTTL